MSVITMVEKTIMPHDHLSAVVPSIPLTTVTICLI